MKVVATNKRAFYDYFVSDKYEAGIILEGSEVKSVREGLMSVNESYVSIKNDEVFLENAYIKPYANAVDLIKESKKARKLLLHRNEIQKLQKNRQSKGMAIIPLRVYLNDAGLVKIEIALAKGKKQFDKRNKEKELSSRMEIQQEFKKR